MNTVQIERQRELLKSIVLDISDVEQIAFGSSMDQEGKQQLLGEKLCQIRQTALDGINDPQATAVILDGYKEGCLDSLLGVQRLIDTTLEAIEEDGEVEPSDEQLQLLAMASRNFASRVEKYLQVKARAEQDGLIQPVDASREVNND